MSRTLIFGVLDWAALLARLAAYATVICRMVLVLSAGDFSGKRNVGEVWKAVNRNTWRLDAGASFTEPFQEALSHCTEGDGLSSMADFLARLDAFGWGDEGVAEGHR